MYALIVVRRTLAKLRLPRGAKFVDKAVIKFRMLDRVLSDTASMSAAFHLGLQTVSQRYGPAIRDA